MVKQKGFTLIESIIYLGLFAVVIGGGMVAAYQIIQATDADSNHVALQEEANFLLRKIEWGLTGATLVNVASSPATLTITKTGLPVLVFAESGQNIQLTRTGSSAGTLNSSSIQVSNLSFAKEIIVGKPDKIDVSFTLTTAQGGRPATQNFSFTKYLRK